MERPHWADLGQRTRRPVDLLAFAGLFLPEEHPDWLPTLRAKAAAGARVRLLFSDPDGRQLGASDEEQAMGGGSPDISVRKGWEALTVAQATGSRRITTELGQLGTG